MEHLIYTLSILVYSRNRVVPFSTENQVDYAVTLYTATKKLNDIQSLIQNSNYRGLQGIRNMYKNRHSILLIHTIYLKWQINQCI